MNFEKMPAHKKIRFGLLAVSFSSLFLLTSCGRFFIPENGTGGGASCTDCIYVANNGSNDVSAFAVTNPLAVVASTNVAVGDVPSSLALVPGGDYLYAGSVNSGVYVFPINSGGSLGTASQASTSVMPYAMAVDPTATYLYTASLDVNGTTSGCPTGEVPYQLTVFPIGDAGALPTANGYLYQVGSDYICGSTDAPPTDLVVSPNGKYVLITLGTGGLIGFTMSGGVPSNLVALAGSTTTNFNGVAIDPTSTYAFVATSGANGGLTQYNLSTLATVGTRQAPTGTAVAFYAVAAPLAASGSYVYVTQRTSGQVYGYSYSSSGMTALTGSPYSPTSAAQGAVAIAADSSSKYIITINLTSGPNLQQFSIGTNGALTATSTGTTSSGTYQPVALAVTAASGS